MKKLLAPALLTVVGVSNLYAQEVIKLQKVLVESEEEKGKISTQKELSQEEVKITRQIDLGEIVSEFYPEIWYIRKAGTANDIVLRGFSRDNINVLIDGSKIYGACPNRMDPPSFHVSSPEIQEVIIKEGPFDVSNQGSLAGLINVKTKDPKEGIGGSIGGTIGSYSYRFGYLTANIGNKYIKFLVGASNQYSKPYESGEGKKITEYANYKPQYIDHKAFNIDRIWTKMVIIPNNDAEIKLSYAYDNARDILYPYLKMDALYDRTNRFNADFNLKPVDLKFSIYYNEVKHDMRDTYRTSSNMWSSRGFMMKTYAETKMFGYKLEKGYNIYGVKIDTGIDGFIRNWKADNIVGMKINNGMIPDVHIKDIGLYIKGVKDIQNWTLSGGLRYDYTFSKADKNALGPANNTLLKKFSNTDNYISGNVIAKYNITKKDNLYVGFGHTVRVPDPEERFIALSRPDGSSWVGNPDLKPTKNNEIDVGGEFFPMDKIGIKGNIFYSSLKDYIYLTGLGTNRTTYKNIDASIYGFDVNVIGAITDKVSAELGFAYQNGKKTGGQYNDSDLAEIPPFKTRLALKYDDGSMYGLVETIYSAKQTKVDTDLQEKETGSWVVFNVKAGYTYQKRLFIGGGIDNLFDKMYYSYLSYLRDPFSTGTKVPEPGRFIYLNASYSF